MTILQVLYVLEVAKQQNISKAAENLFVSQPALSLQIRRLEEELGCELFHREPQGVSLTAAGTAFCKDARLVQKAWERLQQGSASLRDAFCTRIKIGIGPRAISNGLLEQVSSFFDAHPESNVSFMTDISIDTLDALDEKRINLAIDRLPPPNMLRDMNRYAVFELFSEWQCILMSPDDPRAGLKELPFESLSGCAVITGSESSMDNRILEESCLEYGVSFSRIYRADDLNSIMSLVRSGKGIVLGPPSFAKKYHVCAVPMLPELHISLNLICLKENQSNPVVVQLKRFLKNALPTA